MTDDELFSDDDHLGDGLPPAASDLLTADVVGRLIAALDTATGGWYPEARANTTAMMLHRWHSRAAAMAAVDAVVTTWTGTGRPSWGVLQTAYASAAARLGVASHSTVNCSVCDGSGYVTTWETSPVSGLPTSYARRCSHPGALQSSSDPVPPALGRAIAVNAYLADCDLRGVEPQQASLAILNGLGRGT